MEQEKENGNLTVLRKQYAEVENAINNLLNAMLQGIITPSTKQKMDDLEREKADLSAQISKEELSMGLYQDLDIHSISIKPSYGRITGKNIIKKLTELYPINFKESTLN